MISEIKLRPQPLGVYGGTTGALLLPSAEADAVALSGLLLGNDGFEKLWPFYDLAVKEEVELCLQALDSFQVSRLDEAWMLSYNRFVLTADASLFEKLKGELSGIPLALLEAAAYLHGFLPEPPVPPAEADREILAYLLSTVAHHKLGAGNLTGGLSDIDAAVSVVQDVSPVFAARLLAEWAAYGHSAELSERAVEHYNKALALLEATGFHRLRAELALELGMCCQLAGGQTGGSKSRLLQAIQAYQQALLYFHREGPDPHAYGLAHMNLALVYLAMPMNDEAERLRPAIAVQSLREALKVFTRETNAKMWASATLNLANALQHVPSTHNEANLWEAVSLYQEILEVRKAEEDTLAYGRVLANQGNALAHLGAFKKAEPILAEAFSIFQSEGELDSAEAVSALLEEIKKESGKAEV